MGYLMGIDLGGSVAKAAIYNENGTEMAACGVRLDTLTPKAGYTERDPMQIREGVYDAIAGALKKSNLAGEEIAAIGVTGQANGIYLFHKDGTPAYPAILSSDTRAKDYIKRWNEDGTLDFLLPKTRQILWAAQTAALVAWFADHDPETLNDADVIVTAKDYARYLLIGEFLLESTDVSSTSLMDLSVRDLTDEILDKLGILAYKDKFPSKILDSYEIGGYVTDACAQRTGLKAGIPVVGGLIDTVASIISQGITKEEQLGLIVGTWGVNTFITERPIYSKNIFSAFYYCLPGYNLILEGSPTSATNLEWFIQTFLRHDGMEKWDYDKINAAVDQSELRSSLLFLPFLYGTNVNVDAKSCFLGLKGYHDIPDMLRAIYEGVAFCHRYHIDRLLKFREMPSVVRLAGGAARSKVWTQIFADVLGANIEVSEAEELGAMGAAMAAGVGNGMFKDYEDACDHFVHIRETFAPNEERHAYYEQKYKMYCKLIDALDPLWEDLAALGKE